MVRFDGTNDYLSKTFVTDFGSYWLHVLLWPALFFIMFIATARPLKAGLVALGYFHRTGKIPL